MERKYENHKGKQKRKHWLNGVTSSKEEWQKKMLIISTQSTLKSPFFAYKMYSDNYTNVSLFIQSFDVFQVFLTRLFLLFFYMSKRATMYRPPLSSFLSLLSMCGCLKKFKRWKISWKFHFPSMVQKLLMSKAWSKRFASLSLWKVNVIEVLRLGKLWVKYFRFNFTVCGNCWWNIQLVPGYYWQFNFPRQ